MLTTTSRRVPSMIRRYCPKCKRETDHAVLAPTFGFKKNTWRAAACFTCGTRDEQALISPWDMV